MKLTTTLDLTFSDGRKLRVESSPAAFVQYEKRFKKNLTDGPDMTALYWLAWFTLTKGETSEPSFDEWVNDLKSVSSVEDDDPDPM